MSCSRVASEQQISFPEHEGAAALPGTACEKQTLVKENAAGSLTDSLVLSGKVSSDVTDGCSNTNSQRQSKKHETAQKIKTFTNHCHCHDKG